LVKPPHNASERMIDATASSSAAETGE